LGTLSLQQVEAFRSEFVGSALVADDPGYDDARRIHNGLIDKRPAIIARCGGPGDAAAAVRLGRQTGLEISVRGGGHNVAGKAVTEGGVMIDLAPMKQIRVDPHARTITAEGGVTWGELNEAAHLHGLATTGGVISTTGIAGLTLGGGIGWIMGKYGLAVDNLFSAEIVLASGEIVTANEEQEPDLFWAIRGGGGNFGVATSLTYRAHLLSSVLGGAVVHALPAASEVLGFYREFTATLPDEVTAFVAFRHAPDGSGMKLCALPVCHVGQDESQSEADIEPVRAFGPPVMDLVQRMPYPVVNTLVDDAFPRGTFNYWKSAFLTDLSDDAVAILAQSFQNSPTSMCALIIENFHGAATRVDPTATAFPHRQPGYNCIIISQWADAADTVAGTRWARETFDALRPHMADAAYVNYLDHDDAERVAMAYGPSYPRLVELKGRYDPDNVFRLNQNIVP
jgi:FAD/FMN-containing dehydrogenase